MVVKIKRNSNKLLNRLVYKLEEWGDSTPLWIKKEQQTYHLRLDLV
jgi:hypothetical protein